MKNIGFLLIFFLLFNLSCISIKARMNCIEKQTILWKNEDIKYKIQNKLSEILNVWIDKDLKAIQYLKSNLWKVDESVYFNSQKDAAILLVLIQDTTKDVYQDNIQMVYGKIKNGKWHFFIYGMNNLIIERYYTGKKDPTIPYSFEELSNLGKRKLIEGGYLKKCGCKINDEWVNAWYSETLEGMHRDFLNNK